MVRFLANENVPYQIAVWLESLGFDVIHAAVSNVGASDQELLDLARREQRIVLTFDQDFGELIFHQRESACSGVVLFRLRKQPPETTIAALKAFFLSEPQIEGFFTVVSPGQVRQTPLVA